MTLLSGWCTAPPGARPQHGQCRSLTCPCPCHLRVVVSPFEATHTVTLDPEHRQWRPSDGDVLRVQLAPGEDIRGRVADLRWRGDHECTFRLEPIAPVPAPPLQHAADQEEIP